MKYGSQFASKSRNVSKWSKFIHRLLTRFCEKFKNVKNNVWEKSSDLELDYATIISPTVIPQKEFETYKNDLPYYANILREGVEISAWE